MSAIREAAKAETPDLSAYVVCDPAVLGGKPTVRGARVRVQDIYDLHQRQGRSIEELLECWPHLTHSQVYAALAYAWEHREEILSLLQHDEDFAAGMSAGKPSLVEKIRSRLDAADSQVPF